MAFARRPWRTGGECPSSRRDPVLYGALPRQVLPGAGSRCSDVTRTRQCLTQVGLKIWPLSIQLVIRFQSGLVHRAQPIASGSVDTSHRRYDVVVNGPAGGEALPTALEALPRSKMYGVVRSVDGGPHARLVVMVKTMSQVKMSKRVEQISSGHGVREPLPSPR